MEHLNLSFLTVPSAKATLELPHSTHLASTWSSIMAREQALRKCSRFQGFHYASDLNRFKIDTNLSQAVFLILMLFLQANISFK